MTTSKKAENFVVNTVGLLFVISLVGIGVFCVVDGQNSQATDIFFVAWAVLAAITYVVLETLYVINPWWIEHKKKELTFWDTVSSNVVLIFLSVASCLLFGFVYFFFSIGKLIGWCVMSVLRYYSTATGKNDLRAVLCVFLVIGLFLLVKYIVYNVFLKNKRRGK